MRSANGRRVRVRCDEMKLSCQGSPVYSSNHYEEYNEKVWQFPKLSFMYIIFSPVAFLLQIKNTEDIFTNFTFDEKDFSYNSFVPSSTTSNYSVFLR